MLFVGLGSRDLLQNIDITYGLVVDVQSNNSLTDRLNTSNVEYMHQDIEDPELLKSLIERGPFDVIVLKDTLGYLGDIQIFLKRLKHVCNPDTRLISVYYGYLWEPLLQLAELLGLKEKSIPTTWLRMADVENFMFLAGFETVKREWRILCPFRLLGIGGLINRYVATLPIVRKLCLRHYLIARARPANEISNNTVSVVIPCRNEKGNIAAAMSRLPKLGTHTEIVFVEGHSTDGTWEEIQRIINEYPDRDIKALRQSAEGKADAVRTAFDIAVGDILMILDADLTVPPEDLSKFLEIIARGQGEYINGSRLIYGMEDQAMRFINYIANHLFAYVFTYLINQRLTDTLCGTKVIKRKDYLRIAKNREYFGDFDPFGDFDLIFGASKLNLKIVEVPVRYASRRYGQTQISRFRHGLLLIRMVFFAYRKLKAI